VDRCSRWSHHWRTCTWRLVTTPSPDPSLRRISPDQFLAHSIDRLSS
jgi:hypothetical protein